jgi:hypothetical protein
MMESPLHVVRCYSFATDYRPLTNDKCYSNCDLPAIASRSGEAGGAERTNLGLIRNGQKKIKI